MVPFSVLIAATLLFRLLGLAGLAFFEGWQHALAAGLGAMFLLTASAHFGRGREDLMKMVPVSLPKPGLIVSLTGVLELAGAVAIVLPATAHLASLGLAALLAAMFPANVRAARAGLSIRGRPATPLALRTGLQVIFIGALIAAGWRS
jgi:uncharacterized membrane protein